MKSIYPNLDSLMEEKGIDYRVLAKETNTDDTTMYRRLKGVSDFKLCEILKICKYFNNYDLERVFTRKQL